MLQAFQQFLSDLGGGEKDHDRFDAERLPAGGRQH